MSMFYKMTGSGNDFVMVDGRDTGPEAWPVDRIRAVCDRRSGVGADGLVILTPEAPGAVRMTYFNADGSRAAMCGNASLCSTRLAARLGMSPGGSMELRTDSGPLETRCVGGEHMAEIHLPDVARPTTVPEILLQGSECSLHLATVGVPHLVVRVPDVAEIDVAGRGRALRFHPQLGSAGANANFVSPPTAGSGGRWRIRTYERGVEDETLACGTGTVAAAIVLMMVGDGGPEAEFVSWGGMPLSVRARLDDEGTARDVWLGGEGRLVFTGRLDPA